jgi:predicted metal-dependent hydrolase
MPRRLELVSRDPRHLVLGTRNIEYVLVRRRGRRGVGLKVDETGLTVNSPATMPLARIEALVRESEPWILRKLAEWGGRRTPEAEWHDGARLPYLGGGLALRLATGTRARAERAGDELHVATRGGSAEDVRRAVVAWYKRTARDYLQERVTELAAAAGIAQPRVLLSSALARWGSCNARREVRLAWRLVKAPRELIDYVICHELAHLRHMDHSQAFWAEVSRQCPDYRARRERLHATDHFYRSF